MSNSHLSHLRLETPPFQPSFFKGTIWRGISAARGQPEDTSKQPVFGNLLAWDRQKWEGNFDACNLLS